MFRKALSIAPLVNHQSSRGLATLKGIRVRLNPVKKIQYINQSMQMSTTTKSATPVDKVNLLVNKFREFLTSDGTRKALRAAMIELSPPTPAELPRAFRDGFRLFTKGNWREVTVREAWLNTLVTTEVICWFFVGEVIGKGTLIGYQV